jgi:hypothetical protein
MTATIPTTEPTELRVGDTWQWKREDLSSDYPATSWTLTYYFRNATAYFNVVATADGVHFEVTVAKATTAGYTAGDYAWVAVVTSATERFEVDRGNLTLLPDYSASAALDYRTFAAKLLAAVESELTSRGSSGQLDLINATLSDRGLTREAGGLVALRSQLVAEVKREQAAEAMRNGISRNRLQVRFS